MGCHYLDLAFWALDLRHPQTIEASGPPSHPKARPPGSMCVTNSPPAAMLHRSLLTWTHGDTAPPLFREQKLPDWVWGVFVGDKGMLLVNYDQRMLWPRSLVCRLCAARHRAFRRRSAITRNGSPPARRAVPHPATSITPERSPKRCSWATSRIVPARNSSGMRPNAVTNVSRPTTTCGEIIVPHGDWN